MVRFSQITHLWPHREPSDAERGVDGHAVGKFIHLTFDLCREFTRGCEYNRSGSVIQESFIDERYEKCRRFSRAGIGEPHHIFSFQYVGNDFVLDWSWGRVPALFYELKEEWVWGELLKCFFRHIRGDFLRIFAGGIFVDKLRHIKRRDGA